MLFFLFAVLGGDGHGAVAVACIAAGLHIGHACRGGGLKWQLVVLNQVLVVFNQVLACLLREGDTRRDVTCLWVLK